MKSIRVGIVAAIAATVIALGASAASAGQQIIAVDDLYDTPHNTAVTMDPLANDNLPFFAADVTIFYDTPANGSVDSATNLYTPDNGFTGTDEFDYSVCFNYQEVEIDVPAIAAALIPDNFDQCAGATIFVNVGPPPATTTTAAPTTSTTVEVTVVSDPTSTAPPTTVAAAAAAELPRTGSSSAAPTFVLGLGVLCIGLALVSFGRASRRA